MTKVVFVTEDLASNSTGRTYCLWQLTRRLGWNTKIVSTRGDEVWAPLRGTEFAMDCSRLGMATAVEEIEAMSTDIIIGVKPHPWSLGTAAKVASKLQLPLAADIDDPDLEGKLSWRRPFTRAARALLRPDQLGDYKRMNRIVKSVPRSVGNPVLHATYGGTLIPHVRPSMRPANNETQRSGEIEIVFVGTLGKHKGIGVLRQAVGRLHDRGFTLTVTAPPPADAKPWENWVGQTTLSEGLQIVDRASIVAVPSLRSVASYGQFPVKLLDAMFLRKAIVTTSVPPIPWVVGDGAVLARPGSVSSLTGALSELSSKQFRAELGARALRRAESLFSVDRVAPVYEDFLHYAISGPQTHFNV